MRDRQPVICCVCGKPDQPKRNSWEPCCAKCRGVWSICFTSVEDGKAAIKNADNESLEKAFIYEQCSPKSRKSLRVAMAREISKRMKAAKKEKKS